MEEDEYPIYDPLGIEIFAIDETFESLFNGLKGVYFRLFYKESKRPDSIRDLEKEASFYKRFKEIGRLKKSYKYNDWELKGKAVKLYSNEFKEMIDTELIEYPTLNSIGLSKM
ncbi:hypothetical protein IM792_04265 [Mucilaginibacter sp. JRF]|uniref:hypothetical protein n=1 Tax=Mucilaginibacter sp. JRF TaxID=2780088 RepID=UPI00188105B5|nr:hypothetical protein [Mucilaginibacter sp. JRF]MBE9583652.1 hypothetical protein [Mucilaginibacter sp. JRF]